MSLKIYSILIKGEKKKKKEAKSKIGKTENKYQNGMLKPNLNNNYITCKCRHHH